MSTSETILELAQVSIAYGAVTAVSGASFRVERGEFVTLLGPSGSGKTSLLRAIAGFAQPATGRIVIRGEDVTKVPPYARDIGMVFQNYALFPHMTVEDNVKFGLRMRRMGRSEMADRARESLSYVRLGEFGRRYPHELSGGQQQRVAIARALAIRPSLLLLDEPMSNLDARLRATMRVELLEIIGRIGMTTVSVTHNQEEALAMSDRIIVMSTGQIRQIGRATDIYRQPADSFVADFIGDANLFRCRVAGRNGTMLEAVTEDNQRLRAPLACAPADDSVALMIRPEDIAIGAECPSDSNRMSGQVLQVAYLGACFEYRVRVGAKDVLVKRPAGRESPQAEPGASVTIWWDPAAMIGLRP